MQIGALYIRVSTTEQAELSPPAQKRLLLNYAKANDIEIPANYQFVDEGISGKQESLWKRCSFQKMIQTAKQTPSPFSVILVYKFSRFARSQEDSIVYKNLLKKQCGIKVISVTEPMLEGPYGELIERMIEWMDEFYSINLAGEVKKGMMEKAMRGGYQSALPLGYRKGTDKIPTIDYQSAKIVQIIFEKYVYEHTSMRAIAQFLNERQCRTRLGKPFESRTISYILENPFYIGKVRWNRQSHSSHSIRPKSEWILTDGKHEKIISPLLFEQAQNRKREENTHRYRHDSTSCKHWLSGILCCSSCQKTLSFHQISKDADSTYSYFQCYQYSKGQCNTSHSISEKKAVNYVIEGLRTIFDQTPDDYYIKSSPPFYAGQNEFELLSLAEYKLQQKMSRLQTSYLEGVNNLTEYQEEKRKIEKELAQLFSKKKELQHTNTTPSMNLEEKDLCTLLGSETLDFDTKAKMIRSIVSTIVYDKKEQRFLFHLTPYTDSEE